MKKFLLSIALVLFAGATMAQTNYSLKFDRTGTNYESVSVQVTDENGNAVNGVSVNFTSSHSLKGTSNNVTNGILCPDVNANTNPTINLTFTINGVPAGFTLEKVALDIHALNGGSSYQANNDNKIRQWNVASTVNDNAYGSLDNIDIAAGIGTSGVSVHKVWEIANDKMAVDGTVTLKLTITKGTTNEGCFFGLSEVLLTGSIVEPEPEPEVPFLTQVTASDLMTKTEPTRIAIKNLSYTNNRWFVGNTGAVPYSVEDFTNDAIFVWEPVTTGVAGSYYLKKGDTYMQTSSPKDFGTIDNAALFTATAPGTDGTFNGDGDSNLYVTGSNDANLVRFVKGENWINIQNGAGGTPVYNTGTGGWTIHYVYEVTEVASFKANISSAGYATFYAPTEVSIPENVKAYYITAEGINGNNVTLTQIENIIPANTAVILEGEEGEYHFRTSTSGVSAVNGNLLKGTAINTNIIGDAYVLGVVNNVTGLYKTQMTTIALSQASGSVKVFLNNAGKAYLPASALTASAALSAGFRFDFGGTTGVEEVEIRNEKEEIYDLTGRRVNEITKAGVYIVNGKKTLVK